MRGSHNHFLSSPLARNVASCVMWSLDIKSPLVLLNLFQHLFFEILKRVQDDKNGIYAYSPSVINNELVSESFFEIPLLVTPPSEEGARSWGLPITMGIVHKFQGMP